MSRQTIMVVTVATAAIIGMGGNANVRMMEGGQTV